MKLKYSIVILMIVCTIVYTQELITVMQLLPVGGRRRPL